MLAIINAELVMRDHLIPDAVLFVEDGKIVSYGEMRNMPVPEGCEILDAGGSYVGPGLMDIHVHTGGDIHFWEEPAKAAQHHLKHGVTTVLATSYGRLTKQQYIQMCDNVRKAMQTSEGESIGGIYFEGPYLNPKYGANRKISPWPDRGILPEDYVPMVEAAKDLVRVWGIAPESDGILAFVREVKRVSPDVRFAVCHSEAEPQHIEALIPYGLCIGTHHTNATGTIERYPECRGVCVDETVNYNREIYAELICDSRGIHVDPYMLRLVRKIKGDERIILISDQTCYNNPTPAGYEGVTDINFTPDGSDIAGSKLTVDVACRNYMKHTGASIVDAFRVASYNPARATGFNDRGEIREGLRADLILVDHKMNVKTVILGGKIK